MITPLTDQDTADARQDAWETAYLRNQNFVFYPHEEVVRFLARHLRRRVGIDKYEDVVPGAEGSAFLDIGCGIGRHLVLGYEMGFDVHGIDLSNTAVELARDWLDRVGDQDAERRVRQGDVRSLPWEQDMFLVAVSHGVFDSMPFDIAQDGIADLARVMKPDGLFYCDLVAGEAREEIVATAHEENTIQSYFDESKIEMLFEGTFTTMEKTLIEQHRIDTATTSKRWHLVLRRN